MKQLLHAMAIDKNAKPQHMRVLMYVIAIGPGADLRGIPFSAQAVDSAAKHLVVRGIIARDSGRSTFSMANSENTPEGIAPVVTTALEGDSEAAKNEDDRHPFLKRTWEFEQRPALSAWCDTALETGLLDLALHATQSKDYDHEQLVEALDRAEQWAVKLQREETA